MGILSWIVLGLIAGFIGGKIVNRQGQGFWLDIALGIVGALVGGYLFSFFGKEGVTGLNLYSMLVAIAGSVVVLLLYNWSRVAAPFDWIRRFLLPEGGSVSRVKLAMVFPQRSTTRRRASSGQIQDGQQS
jgi:uncharacterized membrane protein YeaQ/YmgE (transglycosylase-associated protein family)